MDDTSLSDGSASTVLYSWPEEPILKASVIPERYKKPKFKVPPSLLSPKPKKKDKARFNVRMHGLVKRKPRYWFKCKIPNCGQNFPNIKAWNQHHAIYHKKLLSHLYGVQKGVQNTKLEASPQEHSCITEAPVLNLSQMLRITL